MTTQRTRSPNYPIVDLEVAIGMAEQLHKAAKRNPIPITDLLSKWNLKASGSRGQQLIAALKQFGLIQDQGTGDKKLVKITDDGLKIVINHADRDRIIKEMALSPKIHRHLWEEYNGSIPPESTLKHHLLFDYEQRFNEGSVDGFVKQFKKTIDFSGLELSDENNDNSEYYDNPENETEQQELKNEKLPDKEPIYEKLKLKPKIGMRQEIFTLEEGDITLEWPQRLSQASYEDFESWIQLVLRKAKRAVSDKKEDNEGE